MRVSGLRLGAGVLRQRTPVLRRSMFDFADSRERVVVASAGGGGTAVVAVSLPGPELARSWQGEKLDIIGFIKPLLLRKLSQHRIGRDVASAGC